MKQIFEKGLLMTTAYSGCGSMEATLSHVVKQTAVLFRKPERGENCEVFSSCDIDAACQLVLKSS
eukprot:6238831-Prorocentrum_lima.AAC.1